MQQPMTAAAGGWRCASGPDFPEAYLLWMPPALFLFDPDSTLATSLIAALALLLTGAAFWADGRGRAEGWAEAVFAFGWMGVWAPACGLLLLDAGRGGDRGGLWAALCLGAGAAALAGAWALRRRRRREPGEPASPAGAGRMVWVVAGVLVALLWLDGPSPLWADAAVVVTAGLLHVLLTPRGRVAGACGALR